MTAHWSKLCHISWVGALSLTLYPGCHLMTTFSGALGSFLDRTNRLLFSGLSSSLENHCTAAAFLFSLAYLPICARCLSVSRPYGPRAQVFTLACRLSITDKTSRFIWRLAGGWILAKSGPVGSEKWPAIDRLEETQQCHSSTAARRTSRARQSGVTCDKYFVRTNFRGLEFIRKITPTITNTYITCNFSINPNTLCAEVQKFIYHYEGTKAHVPN